MGEQDSDDAASSTGWFRRRGRAEEIATLRAELSSALDRAARAEQELAAARAAAPEPDDGGFGLPAEQILRLAESQARATRESAAREASALLERTHAEAERYRDVVAGELTARFDEQERKATAREAALDAREQELVDASAAERSEIARLRRAAVDEAERIRSAAQAAAEDIRGRAVNEAAAEMRHLRTTRGAGEPEVMRLLSLAPDDDR